ncbi:hypothetical protein [Hyphomicrobium sp.]|uniref:hypothetical protein n=1 Tax=Hyphomicrobium sp. TaxID=82 RepID=UPI002FE08946
MPTFELGLPFRLQFGIQPLNNVMGPDTGGIVGNADACVDPHDLAAVNMLEPLRHEPRQAPNALVVLRQDRAHGLPLLYPFL